MNMLLVGGSLYLIALLSAMVLCMVASPNGQGEPLHGACASDSSNVSSESEVSTPNPAAP